jgi:hypothetical protein
MALYLNLGLFRHRTRINQIDLAHVFIPLTYTKSLIILTSVFLNTYQFANINHKDRNHIIYSASPRLYLINGMNVVQNDIELSQKLYHISNLSFYPTLIVWLKYVYGFEQLQFLEVQSNYITRLEVE